MGREPQSNSMAQNGRAIVPQRKIKVLVLGGRGMAAEQRAPQMVRKGGLQGLASKNARHQFNLNFR